jgi:hypothetical protein
LIDLGEVLMPAVADLPLPAPLLVSSSAKKSKPAAAVEKVREGRHGEVLVFFPENPTLGPGRDAWRDYLERIHNGITYRSFLPSDPFFGEWSNFCFPSDCSAPYNFARGKYITSKNTSGYPVVWIGSTPMRVHVAVAYLFGARKRTGYPMSLLLVVDHIAEGNKTNFSLANLQFVTQLQNGAKASNVKEVAKGKGAVLLPLGDAAGNGWYGELFPLYAFPEKPTLGPGGDAWTGCLVRLFRGITYRSFLPTDPYFGDFTNFGFPSDGSQVYNFHTQRYQKGSIQSGYPSVSKDGVWQTIHVAVAYLFGAPKITDMPMSLLLVVDHIKEGNKLDFSLANLQIATQLQNSQKGNGVEEAELEDVLDGAGGAAAASSGAAHFPGTARFPAAPASALSASASSSSGRLSLGGGAGAGAGAGGGGGGWMSRSFCR